jgi:hypothetical protein
MEKCVDPSYLKIAGNEADMREGLTLEADLLLVADRLGKGSVSITGTSSPMFLAPTTTTAQKKCNQLLAKSKRRSNLPAARPYPDDFDDFILAAR